MSNLKNSLRWRIGILRNNSFSMSIVFLLPDSGYSVVVDSYSDYLAAVDFCWDYLVAVDCHHLVDFFVAVAAVRLALADVVVHPVAAHPDFVAGFRLAVHRLVLFAVVVVPAAGFLVDYLADSVCVFVLPPYQGFSNLFVLPTLQIPVLPLSV